MWTFSTNHTSMQSSPAITDGIVYFAAEDWNLYAIGTGLRYTYLGEDVSFVIGENQLIATASWANGNFVADTISFFISDVGTEYVDYEVTANRINLNLYAFPNPFNSSVDLFFTLDQ